MPLLEDITVFAYRGENASISEVLAAAAYRGDLREPAERRAWREACGRQAERDGLEVDAGAVEADISAFRYDHDLISAEETEVWLTERGLDADAMADHFAAEQHFRALSPKVAPPGAEARALDAEGLAQLTPALFLGDGFGPLATALAQRLVASAVVARPGEFDDLRRERRNFLHRSGLDEAELPAWLQALGRSPEWLDRMLELEITFGAYAASVVTPAGLAQALAASRLPLTRVEVERAEFDTLDALREAELCVREDGMTLEAVARESLFPFRRQAVFANELPAAERESFLFARLGDLLRINSPEGDLQIARVVLRAEPSLEDAEVRRRLGEQILGAALAQSAGTDLRWILS